MRSRELRQSVAEDAFPLDGVRLVNIEARDARAPGSLIETTSAASQTGRLMRVTREVLGAVRLL